MVLEARFAFAALALAAGFAGTAPAQPLGACDRACLRGHVDAYLTALAAHEPARLAVAADLVYTENGTRPRSAKASGVPPARPTPTATTRSTPRAAARRR